MKWNTALLEKILKQDYSIDNENVLLDDAIAIIWYRHP